MGQAQFLYIASEIALALLSHPVAAAGLRGDFSDRQKCSARMRKACKDQQGRGVTWLVRVSRAFFFGDFDHAATASGIAALLLLLLLPRLGFCYC